MSDNKETLLRAARDLLYRADESPCIVDAGSIWVRYDGCDCDGMCLREDIENELNIDRDEPPIPLEGGA